jgi:hypothetical protein
MANIPKYSSVLSSGTQRDQYTIRVCTVLSHRKSMWVKKRKAKTAYAQVTRNTTNYILVEDSSFLGCCVV